MGDFPGLVLSVGRDGTDIVAITLIDPVDSGSECNHLWLLKKSLSFKNKLRLGDRKCLPHPRRSLIGHPNAISF